MINFRTKLISVLALASSTFVVACGDSSGPGSVDANGALKSLALAVQDGNTAFGTLTTPDLATAFNGIAPLLTRTTLTIDGANQPMYALGLRTSFPPGTCEETLFVDPGFPPDPGVCTPPSLSTVLVFWQSHSPNEPPDRMLFVVTDPGTVDFDASSIDLDVNSQPAAFTFPAFAFYVQGQDDIWTSLSGSLTSSVAATTQSCNVPLPPYVKSASCSVAVFDEQGQIVLEPFDLNQTSTARKTIAIPQQTLHGLWVAITEIKPVSLPVLANRARMLPPRFGRIAPGFVPAR